MSFPFDDEPDGVTRERLDDQDADLDQEMRRVDGLIREHYRDGMSRINHMVGTHPVQDPDFPGAVW